VVDPAPRVWWLVNKSQALSRADGLGRRVTHLSSITDHPPSPDARSQLPINKRTRRGRQLRPAMIDHNNNHEEDKHHKTRTMAALTKIIIGTNSPRRRHVQVIEATLKHQQPHCAPTRGHMLRVSRWIDRLCFCKYANFR
jgi:hypothetical protein